MHAVMENGWNEEMYRTSVRLQQGYSDGRQSTVHSPDHGGFQSGTWQAPKYGVSIKLLLLINFIHCT